MNIGFDIDGVLTDVHKFQREYGKNFFIKHNRVIKNEDAYSIREMFECTKEEEYKFWERHLLKYCINFPPREGVSEAMNYLHYTGCKIHIISARIKASEKNLVGRYIQYLVCSWLKKIKYIMILYTFAL